MGTAAPCARARPAPAARRARAARRELLRILRGEPALRPRRERRRADPEEAVALAASRSASQRRRLLHPPVLGEPPGELLRGLLRLELGELGVLVGEERSRLELEQRGDQDEELAAGLEVELLPLGEALDEGDRRSLAMSTSAGSSSSFRSSVSSRSKGPSNASRSSSSSRTIMSSRRLAARSDAAAGRPWSAGARGFGLAAAPPAPRRRGGFATRRRRRRRERRGSRIPRRSRAGRRSQGGIDPERLEVEAEACVQRDVEGEQRRRAEADAAVEKQQ